MNFESCVKVFLQTLDAVRYRHLQNLTDVTYQPCGYKTDNVFPTDGWMPYDPATVPLVGRECHYWLKAAFETPSAEPYEEIVLRTLTGKEGHWDATNPQGLLYLNGEMVQGLDTNHTEAFLLPETAYTLHNYFYVGMIGDAVKCEMSLNALDREVEKLYYDVLVPFEACEILPKESDAYVSMMSVLVDVTRLVDFRDTKSESFRRSLMKAQKYIDDALYGELCTRSGKPIVHCIGHTHIDVEWQWTRNQTKEKIQRSFSTAKALMDRYPEYKFMLSQPELYRYLKEEAPEKYEELRQLIAQGRWEPEGAMYLEADCNLISGESLVRQIMHGKRFFREEFGVDSKVLFLPDVFGYNAAMPQILRKSGVDYFVTSKISWNDTNMMPVDEFMWEGIDGTSIFTAFITTQNYSNPPKRGTTYVGTINATQVKGTWARLQQKEYADRALLTFGHGDGGGGPTKKMLEKQRRLEKGLPGMPVTEIAFLRDYLDKAKATFDDACARTARTPKWVGELYLEYHRGTYTSIAKNKKGNRDAEWLLSNAEALSATDLMLNGGAYDSTGLNESWRKVLHDQFHDIIPGSSIEEVYDLTDVDYREITDYGNSTVREKLARLAANIASDGGILVYNPTGFARKAALRVNGVFTETDETVPAYGWKVIPAPTPVCGVTVNGMTAENQYYVMTLGTDGTVVSLYDKRAEREVFRDGMHGNVLTVYEDRPHKYDAWELESHYVLKPYPLGDAASVEAISDGSRAGFKVTHRYMHSEIVQYIWLYTDSTRIDFENEIDWHENHQVLRANFPLNVRSMSATYDIPFGHVARPTHRNTSWDEAKFETCAHKWVDLSENGYGVSLLNNAKYGHASEGSDLSITLLKCATFPNPHADQGRHSFTYSLMPHVGDFREAGVIPESYALNQPLMAEKISAHGGTLASACSMVSCDSENMVITAVKRAEADDGLVVRMYDAFDCKRNCVTVTVEGGCKKAYLCDLMEHPISELSVTDGTVSLPVSNFEIVTLKFVK